MIQCIFTVDYEIHGNGEGSLKELVFDPAKNLEAIFKKADCRFVVFVEVAELELFEIAGIDRSIDAVKIQIENFYAGGFEIGLHLHPQWYNARCENGKWLLDYDEYNLCSLPRERIVEIVQRSIKYLRKLVGQPDFTPLSFRAGNWLFQPTPTVANVLAENGIRLDSSVFKGGLQRRHGLDYRKAIGNDYYWTFSDDINIPDLNGILLEVPTYTRMVPLWKMLNSKRVGLKGRDPSSKRNRNNQAYQLSFLRLLDFIRFRYPLKLDYCWMTFEELTSMVEEILREDQKDPDRFRPIVAIGHTKNLIDFETVERFLLYLKRKGIPVLTFKDVYQQCTRGECSRKSTSAEEL